MPIKRTQNTGFYNTKQYLPSVPSFNYSLIPMDPYCNPNQYNNQYQYGAAPPPPAYNHHGYPAPVNHHAPMPYCPPAHGGHQGHATPGSGLPGAGLLGKVFGQSHGQQGNGYRYGHGHGHSHNSGYGHGRRMKKNKGHGCSDSSGSDSD